MGSEMLQEGGVEVQVKPPFESGITRVFGEHFTWQNTICRQMETEFFRCMERVGAHRGSTECKLEFEDYFECKFGRKQQKRYMAMQEIRKAKAKQYQPPPPYDIYHDERNPHSH